MTRNLRDPAGILLTGFEAFDGAARNPSWDLAQALHGAQIEGHAVQALQLPCVFDAAGGVLQQALRRRRPALVLALGLAAGREAMTPERVAINVDDARIADNGGVQPLDRAIVAGGPAAYFSSLPIKAMVAAMQAQGLPAAVSNSAGTYVCNHVFYRLMHALRRRAGVRGGFMHVPLAEGPEAAGRPALPLAAMQRGLRAALAAACRHRQDLALPGGAEH